MLVFQPLLFLLITPCLTRNTISPRKPLDHGIGPITIAPRGGLPSIPTITLLPKSEYLQTVASTPTVTGSSLTLVQRSEPSDGVDLYLAPELVENVQKAVSQNCPKPNAANCESSIQAALNPQQLARLQARQLLLAVAAVGALAAIAISAFNLYNSGNHIHLPGPDLAQVSSAQTDSVVVYATASDDPNMITVTQSFNTPVSSG